MPMRAYRASTAYAGGHIRDNLWLWIGIFAAITAVALWLNSMADRGGSVWGDVMAFSAMVLGRLGRVQRRAKPCSARHRGGRWGSRCR
jgi:hypothetical protein